MPSKEISKYWDPEHTKMAVVSVDTKSCCYFVDFYLDEKLQKTVFFPGKSLYFVEEAAENFTNDILKLEQLHENY